MKRFAAGFCLLASMGSAAAQPVSTSFEENQDSMAKLECDSLRAQLNSYAQEIECRFDFDKEREGCQKGRDLETKSLMELEERSYSIQKQLIRYNADKKCKFIPV